MTSGQSPEGESITNSKWAEEVLGGVVQVVVSRNPASTEHGAAEHTRVAAAGENLTEYAMQVAGERGRALLIIDDDPAMAIVRADYHVARDPALLKPLFNKMDVTADQRGVPEGILRLHPDRHQPDSAQVRWFRERMSRTGRRMRKVMVVALARKLLIALWRFATQRLVPEGAVMKPAS
jgi:hypothetical protein